MKFRVYRVELHQVQAGDGAQTITNHRLRVGLVCDRPSASPLMELDFQASEVDPAYAIGTVHDLGPVA